MKSILVAAVFDRAVFRKGILVEAAVFHRERVIHDQLHRHDRIDLGRIATHVGNRITQAGEIDERGLTQDVVTHDACRVPGEIEIAFALAQLRKRGRQPVRIAAPDEIFRMHP